MVKKRKVGKGNVDQYEGRPDECDRDPGLPACRSLLDKKWEICRGCEAPAVRETVKRVFKEKDKKNKRKKKGRKGR